MKSVSISEARKRLGTILDDAQRRPVVISRGGSDIAVVVSISEYNRLRSGLVQVFLSLRNSVAAERAQMVSPTFPMTAELRALLEAQLAEHEHLKRKGHITPLVFFRLIAKGRGGELQPKQIRAFNKAWKVACRAAGCPGRIPHDLRRSAIRTFVRAGLAEHVSMKLSGHLTPSVFRRYDIVSEADLRNAARSLDAARSVTTKRAGNQQ